MMLFKKFLLIQIIFFQYQYQYNINIQNNNIHERKNNNTPGNPPQLKHIHTFLLTYNKDIVIV